MAGDESLHVDQDDFAAHLDFLGDTHQIVPLEDLAKAPDWADNRPRVAITFDDAYRGATTAGVEELARRGLPGTIFVAPGLLGNDGCWWDLLASGEGPLDPWIRDNALGTLGGKQDRILAWAKMNDLFTARLPDHAKPAGPEELLTSAAANGIRLGTHTWSHPNLAALPSGEVVDELSRSRDWVHEHAPAYSDWLAYPYGICAPNVLQEAEALFTGACLIEGGPAIKKGKAVGTLWETPRVNVPRDLSLDGLRLRLTGIR